MFSDSSLLGRIHDPHRVRAWDDESAAIHTRAPDAPLPTDADLEQATRLGGSSPEARDTLARLKFAAESAGLVWPAGLGG